MRSGAAAALLSLALAACAPGASDDSSSTTVVTARDHGRMIEVRPGQRVQVNLDANQSTPFRWRLVERPAAAVLEYVTSTYEAGPNGEELVGSGGTSIWTFEAKAQGTTSFGLARVQIGGRPPGTPDFSLTVAVADR